VQALLVGRFHAVTRGQSAWLESLGQEPVERLVCVVTSADHAGTRRNPLDTATREAMLAPALKRSGKPFHIVHIKDIPDSAAWVEHVQANVERTIGQWPAPTDTVVYSANREVDALFQARGFAVVSREVSGLTPHELVQRVAEGKRWEEDATPETRAVYGRPEVQATLKAIYGQKLVNDDGELGHQRDFKTYGTQMDASLRQKLDDLVPLVKPGRIVDKGCGTGKLMVELSKLFPGSGIVGVDLSREFLRMCDENTYATEDVDLVCGNVADQNVADGSATTVVFSSVTHEIYSYSNYSLAELDRAMVNAFKELSSGGRVLIRDGVSPEPATWRLELIDPQARETFERFAREFKHGAGAKFERLSPSTVRLSSHDANEFICKKDYLKNWHIEVHEEFGAHTLRGYAQMLERAGFQDVTATGSVNPWIAQHRYQGKVALFDDGGRPLPWPDTNCVISGARP
jgi:nicotinamide mononucleotide adenylyltransferase/ubiquinone/menaquinone biosynthesis C-methylase UbiE